MPLFRFWSLTAVELGAGSERQLMCANLKKNHSRTRSVAWKKQLAFWSTLRSKHGDVAMHLDAQNTVLQTTEVENRVLNVYVCRLWIGRQNPDQMMNITKVWWFFPSQQASKVGELTWPCHMVPVNSTWPWTKVSRWKPPGSWTILTSPGGEFIKMDSESHEFSIFSWFTSQWPRFDFWKFPMEPLRSPAMSPGSAVAHWTVQRRSGCDLWAFETPPGLRGTSPYPTWGSSENHRLKMCQTLGEMDSFPGR